MNQETAMKGRKSAREKGRGRFHEANLQLS